MNWEFVVWKAIDWTILDDSGHDDLWHEEWCVYAYLNPEDDHLLYLGKADRSTIWDRLHGNHKNVLFQDIEVEFELHPDELQVLHGGIELPGGRRRSAALLTDIESLLIIRLQPWGNVQSRRSRISRPGLKVECVGDWPFSRSRFTDLG